MGNHDLSKGTPISNDIELHNKIGNVKTDPILLSKALFENAEEFIQVSDMISRTTPNFLSPLFTNTAFSCELYLKSILFYNKKEGQKIWGHELHELFKMLTPKLKDTIKEIATTKYHIQNIDRVLKEVNQTFQFARYLHERNSACFTDELFGLTLAVRECAKCFYNLEIAKHNDSEREKLSNHIETSTETLKFWISYGEDTQCNIEKASKAITENLCASLKKDLVTCSVSTEKDKFMKDDSIVLCFDRPNYIYSIEYGNIMQLCQKYFKEFKISTKGLRTNGKHIDIKKEVK